MRFVWATAALWAAGAALGQTPTRTPVWFDSELGSDLGDPFALVYLMADPNVELRGLTVVGDDANVRALMASRFLTFTGRRSTPSAAGAEPQPKRAIDPLGAWRYYYHPDVLFNRTTRPVKEPAVDLLAARLAAHAGKTHVVAAGPLTNVARLLAEKPDLRAKIASVAFADSDSCPAAADPNATKAALASGVPLTLVLRSATAGLALDADERNRVFAPATTLTLQAETFFDLHRPTVAPPLADALAAACAGPKLPAFVTAREARVALADDGMLRIVDGHANARVVTAVDVAAFKAHYVARLAACVAPDRQPTSQVPRGPMPHRVHVAEDYDNDIERFWWMAGKEETADLPPGSRRACRATLTHDFDDLLGHPKAMLKAVIFNPVPGPPMGKRPRLGFRYRLSGTDTLRVQLYTLTNGYHRHLILKGLPNGRWEEATVDMSVARRSDGTGGPLSEGERIDDIQFYVPPTADLVIDDVILYDAGEAGETRPFPKRVHFSGHFDSGTREKHWPGAFDLVEGGYFWKAAQAVASAKGGVELRIGLRGERTLTAAPELSFRYRTSAAGPGSVTLVGAKSGASHTTSWRPEPGDEWRLTTLRFDRAANAPVDEIRFAFPAGTSLTIDDLILYEPGPSPKGRP